MRKLSGKDTGFTLIELLVAAAIAAMVSLVIVAVFSGGINVYSRLRGYSDARKDRLLVLERIEKDIRNVSNISEIEFKGESDKLTFPALVTVVSDKKELLLPGSVSYYIDSGTDYLVREERDYSAATALESQTGLVTQLSRVTDIKFSYYCYDPRTETYMWKDSWVTEKSGENTGIAASKLGTAEEKAKKRKIKVNTPLGVKLELRYEDKGGTVTLERNIFFPLAVSLQVAEVVSRKEEKLNEARNSEKKR